MYKYISLFLMGLLLLPTSQAVFAQVSKRIEVYALTQNYWDVTSGETLGNIVKQLLPDNAVMRKKLCAEILKLNSKAFKQHNPDKLQANVRLWLPNNVIAKQHLKDKKKFNVQSFTWGQVYRAKR